MKWSLFWGVTFSFSLGEKYHPHHIQQFGMDLEPWSRPRFSSQKCCTYFCWFKNLAHFFAATFGSKVKHFVVFFVNFASIFFLGGGGGGTSLASSKYLHLNPFRSVPSLWAYAGAKGIHRAGDLTTDGGHQPAIKGYLCERR